MEVSGALVQHIERGNGICSSSSSLGCAVLGDIWISEALKPYGDLAVPDVVCNEKSRCAGSFQSDTLGFSDKQVNSKVDSITDDPKFKKHFRKKKKNNKRELIQVKRSPIRLFLWQEKDILNPAINCEKGLEKDTPLVNSTSLCEIQVKLCSEDLNIQNCNSRTCCKVPDENKQGCDVCNSSHAIRERNGFKSHNLASELDAVHKTRNHQHIMTGKENSQSVWRKKQRNVRETQTSEGNKLQRNYLQGDASMLQKNLFVEHNSFFGKGLLPTPTIESSRHIGVANAGNNKTKTDVRIHQKVLVESSRWVAHQRLNRRLDRHVSKKGLECQGHNFLRPHNKSCLCKKEFLEVPFELKCYKNPYMAQRTCSSQHGFTHGMSYISARSFHASTKSESCIKFEQFNENQFIKDVTSRMNAKKWVAVGTKGSSISEKTGSAGICHVCNGDLRLLHEVEKDGRSGGNVIDHRASAMLSKFKSTHLIGSSSLNLVETEAPNSDSRCTTTEVHHIKSAEIRMKYGFELETGCPLAEFERFLHSAAPAIASLYQHGKCSLCLGDQLSQGIMKVGDSQKLKGRLTESASFDAHFVPYLSAVQLFGYSYLSNSCGTSEERSNSDMYIRNSSTALEGKNLSAPELKFGSIEESVNSYKAFCPEGHSQSFTPSPDRSSNCELLFEFFETEKPWLQRPLHNKILDLFDAEASYLQVFGDISKLKSLKLNDLHPASWFSVAWYPIFRIPEGKFGAAFLTYHSLGHMVMRDVPTDTLKKKTLCCLPCGGIAKLQGTELWYSTSQALYLQAESWFDLKVPEESSFKDSSLFDRSEILREQLRILEENASLFARGCVWTDGIKVVNRHKDYEFFSSHK
ncbi:hypothetical protein CICLE_v10018263mg [Citrus x clementina]|uniref:Uncharacterized protein n=3 Tax=Citrus TaxID=2706 RepID=V4TJR1_CITCL|nr:hypothetical protein CICLE_v10018263mg [Citrus x clementina]